jgi:hypothetical protein
MYFIIHGKTDSTNFVNLVPRASRELKAAALSIRG